MSVEQTGLKVVDAYDLDDELRSILRPGEMVRDVKGRRHRLPRYFYEVPSYEAAREIRLTQNFSLNEFLMVDLKESPRLLDAPRYIPCAVRLLAFYLQRLRDAFGASVHVSVNGGYRSPAHRMAEFATPHMWGTAADIYRVGSTILKTRESIEKYNRIADDVTEDLFIMPWGHELGHADDHVHVDLGYVTVVPREISEDRMEVPQQKPRFAFEERRRDDRRGARPAPPPSTAAPASPENAAATVDTADAREVPEPQQK